MRDGLLQQPVGARASSAGPWPGDPDVPLPTTSMEPRGAGRGRVVREDLPTPRQGRESRWSERCTWGLTQCLGSPEMPLG